MAKSGTRKRNRRVNDLNKNETVSYRVSYDSIDDIFGLSDSERKVISRLWKLAKMGKMNAKKILEIEAAIAQYPNLPQLYNYLYIGYDSIGDSDKAREVLENTMRIFPGYLFCKVNYAMILINEDRYKEIPKLFGNNYDLKTLYPQREVFHYSEFLAFSYIMVQYFYREKDIKRVRLYYNSMEKIDDSDTRTKLVRELLSKYDAMMNRSIYDNL